MDKNTPMLIITEEQIVTNKLTVTDAVDLAAGAIVELNLKFLAHLREEGVSEEQINSWFEVQRNNMMLITAAFDPNPAPAEEVIEAEDEKLYAAYEKLTPEQQQQGEEAHAELRETLKNHVKTARDSRKATDQTEETTD